MSKGSSENFPLQSSPPGAWEPLLRLRQLARRPLDRFLRIEAASGILLLAAALVALALANSPWGDAYVRFWRAPVGIGVGPLSFERPLEWFVNDGLMVIFFFVVGMEIRREVHRGELSTGQRAALPLAGALGGMLVPAAMYLLLAGTARTRPGWGTPMATDIAFALGVLSLLGARVPAALRVLLLALAVIDDLGAIVVIALFYSSGISLVGLFVAASATVGIFGLQRLGVRAKFPYVVTALVVWAGTYRAGVHPTIAGVIVGLITPVRAWLGPSGFVEGVRRELEGLRLERDGADDTHEVETFMDHIDAARREAQSPAESLIKTLHPWVAFGIMPVFALANAGVRISGGTSDVTSQSVTTAVALSLVAGKPIGVLVASWLVLQLRIAVLPTGISFRHLVLLGAVAGIGFTMSIFIAQLAFTDARLLGAAKIGVLVASGAAATIALMLGFVLLKARATPGEAQTAHEAESSTDR
ncbi:MAG: Na+/H+ antiporter NhaA [Polyangiaceae bacterium]